MGHYDCNNCGECRTITLKPVPASCDYCKIRLTEPGDDYCVYCQVSYGYPPKEPK